jgi:hypothetical protein
MHLPQSVLLNDGGGGAAAAVVSGLGVGALGASAAWEAPDADEVGEVSEPEGPDELAADELSVVELCSAGLSGGLDPPPHANQASGAATTRTRAEMGW